ncbi:MAG: ATP-dependent DNA helicase RecG [Patescibacteria group bacterium]|nr:ATP-dependent DNA helicase RecG [Patescibacteria group bacterium]
MDLLKNKVETLPRIGKAMAAKLKALGILTWEDLIYYFPFRYDDFSLITLIVDLRSGTRANVTGTVEMIATKQSANRRLKITEALVSDSSGLVKVVWFNQPFIANNIKSGDKISLAGKVDEDFTGPYFSSPMYEKIVGGQNIHTSGLVPNYHLTQGLSQKQLRFFISETLKLVGVVEDWLPKLIKQKNDLADLAWSIKEIHFPQDDKSLAKAKYRLSFDELFLLQLEAQLMKQGLSIKTAKMIDFKGEEIRRFTSQLPFDLTAAQKKATWEILQDISSKKPMTRLLEGDVGSGKTIVAMICALNTSLNFNQTAVMAPTEILAKQHYNTFVKFLADWPIKIGLITASEKKLSSRSDSKRLKVNEITEAADIIIGTHALIQEKITFRDLALTIIDEQHRFGVLQRGELIIKKGNQENIVPHLLSMTATPIPRTMALALYDELSISIIKQSPVGRQPVETKIITSSERPKAYDLIINELKANHQVFIICPLIDPSDKFGAKSAKEEYERLNKEIFSDYEVGLLHGKLSAKEKERIMSDFVSGQIKVLVSTAVVEVGVDIPNATVMMIESAERFGLAQLHQYRGRVGRGENKSYCLLMAEDISMKSLERLKCLEQYSSGFDLAEVDLKFRGPGEVFGVLQKGFPELKLANLFDLDLMKLAKDSAKEFIKNNPAGLEDQIIKAKLNNQTSVHLE